MGGIDIKKAADTANGFIPLLLDGLGLKSAGKEKGINENIHADGDLGTECVGI